MTPLLLILGALSLDPGHSTIPCKYSVRDVGFVDFEDDRHVLQVGGEDPRRQQCADSCRALVEGYPLGVRLHDTDPGLRFLGSEGGSIALVEDLDQILELRATLSPLLLSPLRIELGESLLRHLGVVVVVETGVAEVDEAIDAEVRAAVERLEQNLDALEKPTERGPKILRVGAAQRAAERWLLEPLGLWPSGPEPLVGVLFGRGRRLGDVLRGHDIEEGELYRRLALLGQSCECDLDRGWLYGPAALIDWELPLRQLAAATLTFDPENPLVRAEVERILARGGTIPRDGTELFGGEIDDILMGYKEQSLELEPAPEDRERAEGSPPPERSAPPPEAQTSRPEDAPSVAREDTTEQTDDSTTSGVASAARLVLIVASALVLSAVALTIVLRGARPR